MTASQTCQCRRIICSGILSISVGKCSKEGGRSNCRCQGERNTGKEVTPGDLPRHAQIFIARVMQKTCTSSLMFKCQDQRQPGTVTVDVSTAREQSWHARS